MLGPVDDLSQRLAEFDQAEWPEACEVGSKVQHYKKGDIPFYVRVMTCPIRYKNRHAIILATTDLTEMLEKEAQLQQASKMTTLGEMSAGIAHEVNQPLNVIKMGSDFLTMMVENRKTIAEKDLVKVAHQISGQVDRAVEIIEQVIFNLVTNTRDAINQKRETGFAAEDHAITIRSFTENEWTSMVITDTGIGIPADIRDKIFEPFFRKEKPAIVITDIKMPGIDGLAVLQRIKDIDPKAGVIVITGHGNTDLAQRALEGNAVAFIHKPIKKEALDAALQKARERLGLTEKISRL